MVLVYNEPLAFTRNKQNFKCLVGFCRLVSSTTNIYRHVFCYPQSYLLSLLYNSISWSLYIAAVQFGKCCVGYSSTGSYFISGVAVLWERCFHHQSLSYLGTKDFLCKWMLVVFTAPGRTIS